MRLGIAAADHAALIQRGDDIARSADAVLRDHQIDRAGQQQTTRAEQARDAPARQCRIAGEGGPVVGPGRIAFTQIIGNARFGPQDEPARRRGAARPGELGGPHELRREVLGVVELGLGNAWLDEGEGQPADGLGGGELRQTSRRERHGGKAKRQHGADHPLGPGQPPQRAE